MFGKFRKGKSDLSGDNLITILPEKTRYPIYTLLEWHSDKWDAMDYGQDYNPNELFFKQFQELQEKVPHPHQSGSKNIDCDWCDDVWNSKNCYLSRSMEECEDQLYAYRVLRGRSCVDLTVCFDVEKCFDSIYCQNSYRIFYSRNCRDCIDSYFLQDCRNCQNCFMCWNLRGRSYCIENIQYTKDEYNEKINSFNLDSYKSIESFKERFEEVSQKDAVHRENFNLKTSNSTGDYLINTKNCMNCYTINDSEDSFNVIRGMKNKTTIDISGCWYSELVGNCSCCVGGYSQKYCVGSSSRYSEYLDFCIECENCFGCVGLKKKQYFILNKQYSKEEYEKLKGKIISKMKNEGEYGKFIPYSMSPGPFNFSTSFLYFPETKKEEMLKLGASWEEVKDSVIEGKHTSELPDSIKDVSEKICEEALICPVTGWRFNISKNEFAFYKQNNIPLPRLHFDVRVKRRLKYMTVIKSYSYKCFYCEKDIDAYYPHEWGYKKIACEECYKQNIN
jgi:hypothetical protein